MVKRLFYLFYLFLILSCSKQEPQSIVAKIGHTTISWSEFRDRYEFTPHLFRTQNGDQNKRDFLISLLGEKILAEEAYCRGRNKNEKFIAYSEQMEKEAIVEALIDQEISSKIHITDDEVKQGLMRCQEELELQVLSFDNMQQALQAKKMIDAGKSFDQVKHEFPTDVFLSTDSVQTLTLKWGEAHPELEKIAYRLQPNEISEPVEVDGISLIIKLIQKKATPLITETDYLNRVMIVKEKIKQQKRATMFDDFLHSIMADKKVQVSHQIFDLVAYELEQFYQTGDTSAQFQNRSRLLSDLPLDSLTDRNLADQVHAPFALFNDGTVWTVGEFLKKLSIAPFPLPYKSGQTLRNNLRNIIRKMIEFEALAKKGRELGLQYSDYVHYQTQMWNDAYLAQDLQNELIDSIKISDEEVQDYYQQHKNNYNRPEKASLTMSFEDVQDKVKQDVLSFKRRQVIDNYLIQLASKYNIKINQALFDTLRVTNINMMVLKQHFPSRTAAPLVTPLHESPRWRQTINNLLQVK